MMRLIFEIAFMVFWIGMFIIRYPHAQKNKGNTIQKDRKTREEKILLAMTSLGMILLPVFFVATPFLNFAIYTLPVVVSYVGIDLLVPAGILFYRSHWDLGRNWSATLEIREEHSLVVSCIYKHIRHPMYTAIWIWVICQALLLQNYIAGLSGIVSFGLLYFLRVGKEENMMKLQFGEKYISYMKSTKRLIPNLF